MARSPHDDDAVRALPDPRDVPRPWVASYPPGVPPTYRYPDVPVARFLEDAARDFPGVPATWFDGVTLDYEQLRTQVVRFAAGLRSCGVGGGDHVVVACGDVPALPIALFATLRLGAVAVLVAPGSDDVREAVRLNDPVVVVGTRDALEVAADISDAQMVAAPARDWLAPTRRALVTLRRWWGDRRRPGRAFHELLETGAEAPPVDVSSDSPAVVLHGAGRRVVHTHATLLAGAFQARLWVPDVQAGKERILLGAPMTGSFGLTAGLLAGVLSAATLVLPRGREADAILTAADRARPGLALLEPGAVEAAASQAGRLASLRAALVPGTVSDEAGRRFEVLGGVRLRTVHSLAAAGFALAAPVYGRSGPPRAMLPVTDTLAVVVRDDDTSHVVAEGEVGRLAVRGPQIAPDAVAPGGWMLTDDRAVRHPDGWVQVTSAGPVRSAAGGAA